jgi:pimeloyl-ACP methyl ester carboxylesterase
LGAPNADSALVIPLVEAGPGGARWNDLCMPATVVLVHGAWLGGWCWDWVVDGLASRGVTAVAVDLELQTVERDAEIVRHALTETRATNQLVVLVGHSYAGMVISEAGHAADELVYVCAVLPTAGASMLDMLLPAELSTYATTVTETNDDGTVIVNPDRAVEALFHRCPTSAAAAAIEKLRPLAGSCMSAAVTDPAWLHTGASYIVCTDDRSIPPPVQRDWATRVQHSFELDADHYPFYSATRGLVAALAERAYAH